MGGPPAPLPGTPKPEEAYAQHAGIEAVIGRLNVGVRHVQISVFDNQSPPGSEGILEAHSSLGAELQWAGQFRRAMVERRALNSPSEVKKWDDATTVPAIQAEQQCISSESPARVDSVPKYAFVQDFKAADGEMIGVVDDEADLGLYNEQIDVGDIPRYVVFKRKGYLRAEFPMSWVGPEPRLGWRAP